MLLLIRAPSFLAPSVAGVVFENHWVWWAAVLVLGAVLWYVARLRDDTRLRRAGQVAAGVAVLWAAVAITVDTPAERLHAAHTNLAAAVEVADMDRVFSFFEPDFLVPQLDLRGAELALARRQLAHTLNDHAIKESTITDFQATVQSDGTAVSRFTVLTASSDGLIKSTWQLSWNDNPGADWRIQNARLLKLGDQEIPGDLIIR